MRSRRTLVSLLLMIALAALAGCGSKKAAAPVPASAGTLEEVRAAAAKALDANLSSDQRAQAREAAVKAALAFLATPASTKATKADWEKPVAQAGGPVARYFESGNYRVYALSLPGPGVVPPGERVLIQHAPAAGKPSAAEFQGLPGGTLAAMRALDDQVSLAFAYARGGGGYVAELQREAKSGDYKPISSAFQGLPNQAADLTLDVKSGFLVISSPIADQWKPEFDAKKPLRLYLTADVGLDWKGQQFTVVDEKNFSIFEGFHTALDTKAPKADREDAWAKAVRRFPAYLREMSSWTEDLKAKLPPGAAVVTDKAGNVEVHVFSVPAPQDIVKTASFTVIQFRNGGGLPGVATPDLPGIAQGVRVINREGLPGLLLLSTPASGSTPPPKPGQSFITLLRLATDNGFDPAPDWLGLLPPDPTWQITHQANSATLAVTPADGTPALNPFVGPGPQPVVRFCHTATDCTTLSWNGDKLNGLAWVAEKLTAAATPGSAPEALNRAIEAVTWLVTAPEAKWLSAGELAATLTKSSNLAVSGFDPGHTTRLIGFPPTPASTPLVVAWDKGMFVERLPIALVDRWTDARVVDGGGTPYLIVLGRARNRGVVMTYKWESNAWLVVNPVLPGTFKAANEAIFVRFDGPGSLAHGLIIDSANFTLNFATDGKSVNMCGPGNACLTYGYSGGWQLK